MRRESVILMILLGISLSAGCAENGAEESEPAISSAETPEFKQKPEQSK
jgi:hypothetical protein